MMIHINAGLHKGEWGQTRKQPWGIHVFDPSPVLFAPLQLGRPILASSSWASVGLWVSSLRPWRTTFTPPQSNFCPLIAAPSSSAHPTHRVWGTLRTCCAVVIKESQPFVLVAVLIFFCSLLLFHLCLGLFYFIYSRSSFYFADAAKWSFDSMYKL